MLKDKRYFLFDIDGTLAVDETLYDGTKELLDYIEEIGGKSFYITNNSVKSRKDYIEKFARWGIRAEASQFMTASYATCEYLKAHYAGKKLFVLGTPSFRKEVEECGLFVTEQVEPDVACVVAGFDRTLHYGKSRQPVNCFFARKWIISVQIQITVVRQRSALCRIVVESVKC